MASPGSTVVFAVQSIRLTQRHVQSLLRLHFEEGAATVQTPAVAASQFAK
jgi:hypothetical protein